MEKKIFFQRTLICVIIIFSVHSIGFLQEPFTDVTIEAGIVDPNNSNQVRFHQADEYPISMNFGSGTAWIDYDNDGDLDLYISNRESANCMYENNGDGTFTDVAGTLGIEDPDGNGSGVSFADYNNDGWNDFYLCNGHGDRLFRNEAGASFTDVTDDAGFDPNDDRRSTSGTWGDYDNDGFLDLYVSRHVAMFDAPNGTTSQDQLFHNNGDGTFTDVSGLFVQQEILGAGFIGGWFDFDRDGDLDIMLINDCPLGDSSENIHLFENEGGTDPETDWTFTEVSVSVGIDDCRNGMGLAVGDYNRDGWMDIYYSNIGAAIFFENNSGIFTDVTDNLGVGDQDGGMFSWGTSFLDYNNDGWQDLFLVGGSLSDSTFMDWYPSPNYFYENNGDDTFSDISSTVNMNDERRGRNGVCGDYDNDGDLDIFLLNYAEGMCLRKNNNDNGYHWTKIELQGVTSNRNGIGAKIKLTTPDGVVQHYETRSGSNLGGGDALQAHFGLKDNTSITEIEVTWPSGIIQTETNLDVDEVINLLEPDPPLPVDLAHFYAQAENNQINLHWNTLAESNHRHFDIQRSHDALSFQNIGQVQSSGFSNGGSYQYTDRNPDAGDNYYRLRQVDIDGSYSYSDVEYVHLDERKILVEIAPNPVSGNYFEIQLNQVQEAQAILYDVLGNIVLTETLLAGSGNEVAVNNLANGIYFLNIESEAKNQSIKILINR